MLCPMTAERNRRRQFDNRSTSMLPYTATALDGDLRWLLGYNAMAYRYAEEEGYAEAHCFTR